MFLALLEIFGDLAAKCVCLSAVAGAAKVTLSGFQEHFLSLSKSEPKL